MGGEVLRLVTLALGFATVSPLLGIALYHERVRRLLLRLLGFLLVFTVTLVLWGLLLRSPARAALLAAGTAALVLLPWRKTARWWRRRRLRRRQARELAAREAEQAREEQADLARAQEEAEVVRGLIERLRM